MIKKEKTPQSTTRKSNLQAENEIDLIKKTNLENDVYPNYVNLDTDTLTSENKELNRKAGRDSIVLLKIWIIIYLLQKINI